MSDHLSRNETSGQLAETWHDGTVTVYRGDARNLDPAWLGAGHVLLTDPPYPNNGGHFDDDVSAARDVLSRVEVEAIVFWNELSRPPVPLPLVAVHVWHRANVNGRPYESAYHFAPDGIKRRSEVYRHAAIFDGAGPGCWEYAGHPTQKPVALMWRLLDKLGPGIVLDPFCGVGSTLRAAKDAGRQAIGIEIEDRYCQTTALRLAQEVLAV